MRRIVCAANVYKNLMVLGARHFDLTMHRQIEQSVECSMVKPSAWEQGFIDQWGVFLTRSEAFVVATAAGQIIRRVGGDDGKLFSENLY